MKLYIIAACLIGTSVHASRAQEARTVEWFVNHPDDLNQKLTVCGTDSDVDLRNDPECLIAAEAGLKRASLMIRDMKAYLDDAAKQLNEAGADR